MAAVPPKLVRPPQVPRQTWILAGGLVGGLLVLVFCFDPTRYHFYPICQFHRLTGWNCPGCGMTRALFALLHGHFQIACRDNALLVFGLPLLLGRVLWWFPRRQATRFLPNRWFWVAVSLTVIFGIVRNLPGLAFLSPLP